jgi:hypothetical protein
MKVATAAPSLLATSLLSTTHVAPLSSAAFADVGINDDDGDVLNAIVVERDDVDVDVDDVDMGSAFAVENFTKGASSRSSKALKASLLMRRRLTSACASIADKDRLSGGGDSFATVGPNDLRLRFEAMCCRFTFAALLYL